MLQWVSAPRDEEVLFLRSQASGGISITETTLLVSVKYSESIQKVTLNCSWGRTGPASLMTRAEERADMINSAAVVKARRTE